MVLKMLMLFDVAIMITSVFWCVCVRFYFKWKIWPNGVQWITARVPQLRSQHNGQWQWESFARWGVCTRHQEHST